MSEGSKRKRAGDDAVVGPSSSCAGNASAPPAVEHVGPFESYAEVLRREDQLPPHLQHRAFWYRGPPLDGDQMNRIILRPRREQAFGVPTPAKVGQLEAAESSQKGNIEKEDSMNNPLQQMQDGRFASAVITTLHDEVHDNQRQAFQYPDPPSHGVRDDQTACRPLGEQPLGDTMPSRKTSGNDVAASVPEKTGGEETADAVHHKQPVGRYGPVVRGAKNEGPGGRRRALGSPAAPVHGGQVDRAALHPCRGQPPGYPLKAATGRHVATTSSDVEEAEGTSSALAKDHDPRRKDSRHPAPTRSGDEASVFSMHRRIEQPPCDSVRTEVSQLVGAGSPEEKKQVEMADDMTASPQQQQQPDGSCGLVVNAAPRDEVHDNQRRAFQCPHPHRRGPPRGDPIQAKTSRHVAANTSRGTGVEEAADAIQQKQPGGRRHRSVVRGAVNEGSGGQRRALGSPTAPRHGAQVHRAPSYSHLDKPPGDRKLATACGHVAATSSDEKGVEKPNGLLPQQPGGGNAHTAVRGGSAKVRDVPRRKCSREPAPNHNCGKAGVFVMRRRAAQLPSDSVPTEGNKLVAAGPSQKENVETEDGMNNPLQQQPDGRCGSDVNAAPHDKVHDNQYRAFQYPEPPLHGVRVDPAKWRPRREHPPGYPFPAGTCGHNVAAGKAKKNEAKRTDKHVNNPLQLQRDAGYGSFLSGASEGGEEEERLETACSTGTTTIPPSRKDLLRMFDAAQASEKTLLSLVEEADTALTEALGSWERAKETTVEQRLAAETQAALARTLPLKRLHATATVLVGTTRRLLDRVTEAAPNHKKVRLQHHQRAGEARGEEGLGGAKDEADEKEGCMDQPAVGKDASLNECGIFEGVWELEHEHEDGEEAGEQQQEQGEGSKDRQFVAKPIHGRGAYLLSVGNLSASTTTQDILAAFGRFTPRSCSMLTHHPGHAQSARFAVLGFQELAQAADALRKMRHANIDSHSIKVRAGGDGVESSTFRRKDLLISAGGNARWAYQVLVGNLAWGVTSRMLAKAIEGRVGSVGTVYAARVLNHRKGTCWRGCPNGMGWLIMSSKTDAKNIVSSLGRHELELMGRAVHPGGEKVQRVLLTTP